MEIAETGPRVPVEERTEIFEPFFSGSRGRAASREGVGLGLYVSHERQ